MESLLNESQVAKILQLTPRALQRWRLEGRGPRFVRLSRRCIRYKREDICQWIENRIRVSTSDSSGEIIHENDQENTALKGE